MSGLTGKRPPCPIRQQRCGGCWTPALVRLRSRLRGACGPVCTGNVSAGTRTPPPPSPRPTFMGTGSCFGACSGADKDMTAPWDRPFCTLTPPVRPPLGVRGSLGGGGEAVKQRILRYRMFPQLPQLCPILPVENGTSRPTFQREHAAALHSLRALLGSTVDCRAQFFLVGYKTFDIEIHQLKPAFRSPITRNILLMLPPALLSNPTSGTWCCKRVTSHCGCIGSMTQMIIMCWQHVLMPEHPNR